MTPAARAVVAITTVVGTTAFLALNFIATNSSMLSYYGAGAAAEVWLVAAAMCSAMLVILYVSTRFGDAVGSSAALSVLAIHAFLYKPFARFLMDIGLDEFGGAVVLRQGLIAIAFVACGCAIAYLAYRIGKSVHGRYVALTFLLVCVAQPIAKVVLASPAATVEGEPQSDLGAEEVQPGALWSGEDAYIIVLDGYLGARGLSERFGYDVSAFIEAMRSKGFMHADRSRSNSLMTFTSMANVFAMDYVVDERSTRYVDRRRFYPANLSSRDPPPLLREAQRSGYEAWMVGNAYAPCWGIHARCIAGSTVPRLGPVGASFLSTTPLSSQTLRRSAVGRWLFGDAIDDPLKLVGSFIDSLPKRGTRPPVLVFAHVLEPHPPYNYDAECNPRESFISLHQTAEPKAVPFYLDSISCLNMRVKALVSSILARDEDAMIVVMADHGSGFSWPRYRSMDSWTATDLDERTDIMNLVRLPERCRAGFRRDLGQINTVRLLSACLGHRPPRFVEEKTVLGAYEDAATKEFGRSRDFRFGPP
jgi:hypothetical protein